MSVLLPGEVGSGTAEDCATVQLLLLRRRVDHELFVGSTILAAFVNCDLVRLDSPDDQCVQILL